MRRILAAIVPLALAGLVPVFAEAPKVVVRGAHPDPETIAKLVEKLGERDFKTREAAAKELETRGIEALPEIRKAYEASVSAEVRHRLQGMVQNLERMQILAPKRITIHMKDRPLADAIDEIVRQTGYPIQYQNRANNRLVTIDKDKASFWEVMDHFVNTVGINLYHNENQGLVVYDNESQVWPHVVYQGPFKIVAQSFNYNKTMNLGPLQRNPMYNQVRNESLSFQFVLYSEPKLPILGVGQPKILEAVDELGNSMKPRDNGAHEAHYPPNFHGNRSFQCGPGINLSWPNKEAKNIKRLRVSLPVILLSETKPEIIVEPIVGLKNKKFTGGSVEMQIAEVQFDEHKVITVYAHNLKPFRKIFKSFGIPRDDEMRLISEGEHLHATDPEHYPEFKRFCQRLGIAKLSRVR